MDEQAPEQVSDWDNIKNYVGAAAPKPMADPIQAAVQQNPGAMVHPAPDASQVMGISPDQRLTAALGSMNPTPADTIRQAGAGIADTIAASGGNNTNYLKDAQGMQQDRSKQLLSALDTRMSQGSEQYKLLQELQSKDPSSAISRTAQSANAGLLKKAGLSDEDISKMPASMIGEITGKSIDSYKAQGEHDLAKQTKDYQQQLAIEAEKRDKATADYQKGMLAHQVTSDSEKIKNDQAQREHDERQQRTKAADDVVHETSKWNPLNLLPGSARSKALNVLSEELTDRTKPVAVTSEAEYNQLPSGAVYIWNGVEHKKK